MKNKILVAMPQGKIFDTFFNDALKIALEKTGNVEWNTETEHFSKQKLIEKIVDVDILVTGWGCEPIDAEVLASANKLKFIAHTGGSVNPYVTDEVYESGIRVCSGNTAFAESVAEGVIAYALASLRDIPRFSDGVKNGEWPSEFYNRGLLNRSVGVVGYGMIAKIVVDMLKAFHCPIKVFSNYTSEEELSKRGLQKASLEEIFSTCDIVSIHSGMTKANYHLVTRELLKSMKPGTLLVNTARGAIIDEAALCDVLAEGKINAVLDVYETEPLPAESPLRGFDNAILMPHMGGPTIDRRLVVTKNVIEDINNFLGNKPLICEIDRSYAKKMSGY